MDNNYLLDLLSEVKARGGGMILSVEGKSSAVVLSIDKYNQLLLQGSDAPGPKTKTVLVTGGAGYVGSHTVRALLSQGHRVLILDNFSTGRRENVPDSVLLIEGDAGDVNLLRDIFSQNSIDAVVHLAASLEVKESFAQPQQYADNNFALTHKLLSVMGEYEVKTIIFSSTGCVYGNQEKVPINEDATLNPNNPYGYSKLLTEQLIGYYARFMGFRATIFRYFNVCGAGQKGELSDTHAGSHVIPIMLAAASGKTEKFVVNGKDYDTYDGTTVRDYIHVDDIAVAHTLALEAASEGPSYKIYNVGTGRGLSIEELLAGVAEITGKMIPVEIGPRREGDEVATVADTARIKAELGFVPQHSSLENIIQTSWAAYQQSK